MKADRPITLVGAVNKSHGVKGEISISFFNESFMDSLEPGRWLLFDIDGIFTPFKVESVRPRASETLLVSFHGINSQEETAIFASKKAYAAVEANDDDTDESDDGLYAGQLIGFTAYNDDGTLIGEIIDLDESTENALFIIKSTNGSIEYIPIADEFITDISTQNNTITFDLPLGLLQN